MTTDKSKRIPIPNDVLLCVAVAISALAIAGCGEPPPPDTRPRAEVAGPIAMPDGWDAKVVVLPTGERVLMASRSWCIGNDRNAHSITAVLLPPVAAEGEGVGP